MVFLAIHGFIGVAPEVVDDVDACTTGCSIRLKTARVARVTECRHTLHLSTGRHHALVVGPLYLGSHFLHSTRPAEP